MDDITNSVKSFNVSDMHAEDLVSNINCIAQHPRFVQYKNNQVNIKSQEERRRLLLDEQKKFVSVFIFGFFKRIKFLSDRKSKKTSMRH
jgi:hypothetical protein